MGDRVVHVALDQLVDGTVEGCREQQALALGGDGVEDRPNGLHETQLGHVIGLVEDRHRDAGQVGVTGLQQIDEASRSGDDEVNTLLEGLGLRAVAHATGDEDG